MSENAISKHGWTAVPRSAKALLNNKPYINAPTPLLVSSLQFPSSPLITKIQSYAKKHLPLPTYNHSMRVFHFGITILRTQFPSYSLSPETYALTALLHDIGTTPENLRATKMSFEFYGGILALDLLKGEGAEGDQAEAVAEAIFRHQDLGEVGKIGILGAVIQLATVYDNMGGNADLIHENTRVDVCEEFPRLGWSSCFAKTIREENGLKPWCHTTALGEDAFPEGVLGNELMAPYDRWGLE